ncbi:alanine racemase [Blautia liquoris]|uniref:Alanine racemase n=1 Tax=Blautia liquoris TaxID=2779518 RepID=A0A7M2RGW4_9FIRM|nr:alanine racemase [Blautia liquoris]QOV18602.1 alanine racemase [Blautia liquoris]
MEMTRLEEGIVRYGTPLYVFHIDEMRENFKRFRSILQDRAGLCFAMKANPFLTSQMNTLADRIEVCSMGEFQICKKRQIHAENILVSGVMKKKEDIFTILNEYRGKCTYTIESLNQFHCFAEWCDANSELLHVYLRLTSGNQFGMDLATIENIIEVRDMCPFLKIQGIHYFSGTQKKIEKTKEELKKLDVILRELEEKTNFLIEELEYGPGLFVPYFSGQKDTVESDLQEIADAISRMQWKGSVMLEMGRALVAKCGYYLTSVRDIKQTDGKNYCIVDGGIHQINYDGQIRGMYQPMIRVSPEHTKAEMVEWTVCGSLCTVNDVLVQKVDMPRLRIGSVLIFERTGAYAMTEGMSMFLSHELPQIAFYSKEMGWKLVRREYQTYEKNMEEF